MRRPIYRYFGCLLFAALITSIDMHQSFAVQTVTDVDVPSVGFYVCLNETQEEYEDQGIVQGKNSSSLGISHDQLIKVIEKELKSRSIQPNFETDPDSNSDHREVVEKTTGLIIHSAGPKQDLLNVAVVVLYDQFMSQTIEGRQSQEHFMALNKAVGKAIAPNAEVDFMSQINKLAARGVAEIQLGKKYQAKIMLQRNAKGKKVIVFLVSGAPNSR